MEEKNNQYYKNYLIFKIERLLGIGDLGLRQSPIPNPQSPIPNPQILNNYHNLFL